MRFSHTLWILMLWTQAVTLTAGDRWNIRAIGMGRTSVADARGIEAIGINPADLACPGRSPFSLTLAPVGVQASTQMISYDIYQEYFTGIPGTGNNGKQDPKNLTDEDKQNLLAFLPDGLAATKLDIEVMDIGATITVNRLGGLGAAVIDRASASLEMPKDYARFFLYGLDSAGSRYNFNGTSASAAWWREFNISYAYRIVLDSSRGRSISIGVGVKLLQGFGIFETQRYSATVANQHVGTNQYLLDASFDYLTRRSGVDFLNSDNSHADFALFPEPAGTGVGYDLGVSAQIRPGLFIAASITDIGKISWTKNLVKTYGSYSLLMDDPFATGNVDSLKRALRGVNQPGDAFSSSLPTVLRIGASIQSDESDFFAFLPRRMLLALDYTQGLNSSMGNITKPRISMGVEYRVIPFLPLRTGISVGGGDIVRWAGGFGFDFNTVCFDIGTENMGMLFTPKTTQMVSVAAGLKVLI